MKHLIDKDALVAKIKRKRNQEVQWMDRQGYTEYHLGLRDGYADILSFLDSLEVKEVDLKKEIDKELDRNWYGEYINLDKFRESAKHFFELGLKAQKGE